MVWVFIQIGPYLTHLLPYSSCRLTFALCTFIKDEFHPPGTDTGERCSFGPQVNCYNKRNAWISSSCRLLEIWNSRVLTLLHIHCISGIWPPEHSQEKNQKLVLCRKISSRCPISDAGVTPSFFAGVQDREGPGHLLIAHLSKWYNCSSYYLQAGNEWKSQLGLNFRLTCKL